MSKEAVELEVDTEQNMKENSKLYIGKSMTSRGKGAHLVKRAQTCLPPPTSCNSVTPSSHRAPIPPSYIFMRFHAQQADESSSCCQSSCILPLKHAIQAINLRENKIRRRRHPIQPKYEHTMQCAQKNKSKTLGVAS